MCPICKNVVKTGGKHCSSTQPRPYLLRTTPKTWEWPWDAEEQKLKIDTKSANDYNNTKFHKVQCLGQPVSDVMVCGLCGLEERVLCLWVKCSPPIVIVCTAYPTQVCEAGQQWNGEGRIDYQGWYMLIELWLPGYH